MEQDTLRGVVEQVLQSEAEKMVKAVSEFVRGLGEGGAAKGAEELFRGRVLTLGAALMTRALEVSDPDLRAELRRRGHRTRQGEPCSGTLASKGMKTAVATTLLGDVRAKQWTARCRKCGQDLGTVDEILEVVGGLSAACASAVTLAGVMSSFEKAADAVGQMTGVKVDDNRVQRTVALVAPRAKERMNAPLTEADLPPEGTRVHVLVDGGRIRMRGKGSPWREPCTAMLIWKDAAGKLVRHAVSDPLNKQPVLAVMDEWMKLLAPGRRREVLIIADGAEWIWSWADKYPWAFCILDYYHLKEHVWDAAKVLFGEGSALAAAWVDKIKDRLWLGWVPSTIAILEEMEIAAPHADEKREAVDALATYLRNHQGLIKYQAHRDEGRTIGSGWVESFCKQLFSMRMKGPGMFWSEDGARDLMTLRTLYLTGRWEDLWSTPQKKAS